MTTHMPSSSEPVKRVYELIQLEKRDIVLLIILTVGYGLLGIATPVAIQAMVNIVTMGGVLQPLYVVGLILFCLLSLSGVLYVLENYLVEMIQRRIYVRSSLQIAQNAQRIQIQVYDNENPVELMNRYFDITTVQKATATLLTIGLTAFLQGIIGSIVLLFYSLYFGILVMLVFVMLWMIIWILGREAEYTAIKESKAKYAMAAWLENIARNMHLFKFYGAKQRAEAETAQLVQSYLDVRIKHFKVLVKQLLGAVGMYAMIGTAMLVLGGTLVITGQINLGQFVAAELIIFGVLSAFVRFVTNLEYFYDLLASVDKLSVLENLPLEPQTTASQGQLYISEAHHFKQIQLHGVVLPEAPQSEAHVPIQVSLTQGESLAVLGSSGTGKTMLLQVLSGLRQPSQGYVSVDGIDLRQIDLDDLRNHIGYAGKIEWQHGSILDNLRLGRKDISIGDITAMLKAVNLWDDISQFERGIETELTDIGAPMSQTQLQRLMLVRALIGKPSIVLIDGLLDLLNQSELDDVLHLLKQHQSEWMLIITTRFLHIAQQCSKQLVLDEMLTQRTPKVATRIQEQP